MPKSSGQGITLIRNERSQKHGESLRKWRRWYADGDTGGIPGASGQGDSGYNPATVEDAQKIIAALQKRIGEREATINELKQSSSSQADRLKAIEDAQRKQLEEQGNFSELAKQRAAEIESLRPKAALADDAAEFLKNLNDQTAASIPETYRKLVPDFGDSYEAQKRKAAWLRENMSLLTKPPAPDFDAGAGGNSGGGNGDGKLPKLTESQKLAARNMRMSEEQYAKQLQDIQRRRAEAKE